MGHHSLFSVAVEHGYFTDGWCRDLSFEPTMETTANLSRLNLVARTTRDGVVLFVDDGRADGLRMRASDIDPLWFAWRVRSTDRAFENYTTPPVRTAGSKVLFFSNSRAWSGGDDGRSLLHDRERVASEDFRDWDELATDGMPEGLGGARDRRLPPHFVVAVRVGAGHLEGASGRSTGADYVVRFAARETVWKYYVLGLAPKIAPHVADADSRFEFVAGADESLAGGRKARVFRSGSPITLRDRFDMRLQLRESSAGNGKVLVRRLPVATAAQIYREVVDGNETVVSEIYVNC
jgi:hypothetical protein